MSSSGLYAPAIRARRKRCLRSLFLAGSVASWLTITDPTGATTVLPLTIEQLADAAAQVIDGVVASTECFRSDDAGRILTRIRLTQVTYHKGRLPDSGDTFELVVCGGAVGDASLRITGAPRFKPGQRWLLFLHATYNIHPVVGIHRGAFRVIPDSCGRLMIHGASGAAITGFNNVGLPVHATAATVDLDEPKPRCVLGGTSGRVVGVRPLAQAAEQPMTYDEFLDRIRPVLAASRDHSLSAPAGRPEFMRPRAPAPLTIRSLQHTQRRDSDTVKSGIEAAHGAKEQFRGQ